MVTRRLQLGPPVLADLASSGPPGTTTRDYELAVTALRNLPDHSAADVNELAERIGVQKLTLIGWLRADLQFARLAASKVNG
jgi:hypothetical protein